MAYTLATVTHNMVKHSCRNMVQLLTNTPENVFTFAYNCIIMFYNLLLKCLYSGYDRFRHVLCLPLFSTDESVDAQTVLREMTQACFSSYNFHSVTIQMERQADLRPGCTLCEDPKM